MNKKELFKSIKVTKSFLCIGLDPDLSLVPAQFRKPQALFDFLKAIIIATSPYCVAYKLNIAFYECLGAQGLRLFDDVLQLIPTDKLVIADAKRGDIGNTATKYAESFYDRSPQSKIDAVTLNPYMGKDSVLPFLAYKDKWAVILALTSNSGAANFQLLPLQNGLMVFEEVIKQTADWGTPDTMMFVVGANRAEMIGAVRKLIPEHFLLIPGVGAQGGNLEEVARYGLNATCGLLINAGRSVLYASPLADFASAAAREAHDLQTQMSAILDKNPIFNND